MLTRTVAASILVGAVIAALLLTPFVASSAPSRETQMDWSHLKVVTYSSGMTGFFDPSTGKLYVYDADVDQCLFVRQLDRLGAPLRDVKE